MVADPSVRQSSSEFDRLIRDNLATIKSFGSNPMDIICRDACDGHNVGRVSVVQESVYEMRSYITLRCSYLDWSSVWDS